MKTELKRDQQWRQDRTMSLLCRRAVKHAALELGQKEWAYGMHMDSRGSWDLKSSWVRRVVEPSAENDDADVCPW